MPESAPLIRNAARALIVREGGILLLRKEYETGAVRYALPGGAQEEGETLLDALTRECLEEIGTRVDVCDLAYVAEYFRRRSTVPAEIRHLFENLFRCEVPADYVPVNGEKPDKHQVAVEWVPLERLADAHLSHPFLTEEIARGACPTIYLGVFRDGDADSP